jgi:AcrR family transcriptional regulator
VSPRAYNSPRRDAAATKTRTRIVAAAVAVLGAPEGIAGFSLEEVARRAGVTRLTVYNQFGSRRALLEAVFDERAARGGLHRLAEAMAASDPNTGLLQVVAIFCDFWSHDPQALKRLHDAIGADPEFEVSVRERNERRRSLLLALIARMTAKARPSRQAVRDLVDVLFALTSYRFFSALTEGGRKPNDACRLIQQLAKDAVRRTIARSE